jgi:hypothetical protein
MLQGWGGRERRNVDGGFLKGTKCGKAICVYWFVAMCNPGLIFFPEEACAMDDTNTNINDVICWSNAPMAFVLIITPV